MTAAEVIEALRRRHGLDTSKGEWVGITEAFSGFTSAGGGIDLLAIGAWASANVKGLEARSARPRLRHPVVAYEVKVSRADLRRELYGYVPGPGASYRTRSVPPWPGKAYWALARSHYFFLAVPSGLLTGGELDRTLPWATGRGRRGLYVPEGIGVVEVSGTGCRVTIPAGRREGRPLEAGEIAELIRHAVDPNKERRLRERVRLLEEEVELLRRRAR